MKAESNLARYGRAMLTSLPEETTQLLIDLCTSSGPLTFDSDDSPSVPAKPMAAPSYLSYLALNRASAAPPTVSSDNATPPSPSIKTFRPGDPASRRGSIIEDSRPTTPLVQTANIL